MTAPPLPPCPVCGKEPHFIEATRYLPAKIACFGQDDNGWQSHDIAIFGCTDEQAAHLWRRVVGGGRK